MRLIDANEVVKDIVFERDKIPRTVPAAPYELVAEKPFNHGNSMRGGIRKALRCIEQAPTIDAVPVVRCRECKHSSYDEIFGNRWCNSNSGCRKVKDDGYCDLGERKEGVE